jgi:hypothetical protein
MNKWRNYDSSMTNVLLLLLKKLYFCTKGEKDDVLIELCDLNVVCTMYILYIYFFEPEYIYIICNKSKAYVARSLKYCVQTIDY